MKAWVLDCWDSQNIRVNYSIVLTETSKTQIPISPTIELYLQKKKKKKLSNYKKIKIKIKNNLQIVKKIVIYSNNSMTSLLLFTKSLISIQQKNKIKLTAIQT